MSEEKASLSRERRKSRITWVGDKRNKELEKRCLVEEVRRSLREVSATLWPLYVPTSGLSMKAD